MDLILYTNPRSRGRMARWALEESGAAYEVRMLHYGAELKSPAFCALNPMGKIPVLCHGDVIITEAAAIIAYLADAFAAAKLAPPVNSPLRGAYYRWLFFAAGPLEAAITVSTIEAVVPPEKSAFIGYGSMPLVLDVLEKAVSAGPYLLGDEFSAADIYLASQLSIGTRFGRIEPRAAFEAYIGRAMSRPAQKRAAALDDAAIPEAS